MKISQKQARLDEADMRDHLQERQAEQRLVRLCDGAFCCLTGNFCKSDTDHMLGLKDMDIVGSDFQLLQTGRQAFEIKI